MSEPPAWGPPPLPPQAPPPPPPRPRRQTGFRHAVKKSFTDWRWIRANPFKAVPILAITALFAAGFISALADPSTYKDKPAAAPAPADGTTAPATAPASAPVAPGSTPPVVSTTRAAPTSAARSTPAAPSTTKSASSPPPSTSAARPSSPAHTSPPSYPGRTDDDIVAGADRSVRISGFTVTLGPLRRTHDPAYEYSQLCASVSLLNRDTSTQDYSDSDFSIQYPNGNVKGTQLVYSGGIDSGQLVHGGTTHGRVCFVPQKARGLYVVSWSPDLFNDDRAVWLYRLH